MRLFKKKKSSRDCVEVSTLRKVLLDVLATETLTRDVVASVTSKPFSPKIEVHLGILDLAGKVADRRVIDCSDAPRVTEGQLRQRISEAVTDFEMEFLHSDFTSVEVSRV